MPLQGRKICLHTKKKNWRFCGNLCHLEASAIKIFMCTKMCACMYLCADPRMLGFGFIAWIDHDHNKLKA